MIECPVCRGQGLVGSGENPHLLEGLKKTCENCNGTGKVADGTFATPGFVPEPVAEVPVESNVQVNNGSSDWDQSPAQAADAAPVEQPVDNSTPSEEVQGATL